MKIILFLFTHFYTPLVADIKFLSCTFSPCTQTSRIFSGRAKYKIFGKYQAMIPWILGIRACDKLVLII